MTETNVYNILKLLVYLFTSLLLTTKLLQAETLVLIQGYQAKGSDWRDSGVVKALVDAGWSDIGHIGHDARPLGNQGLRLVTIDLETEAPLMYQLAQFKHTIDWMQRTPARDRLIFVAHSAGGVLGRLYMVKYPESKVAVLITFATPHLGTESAELGVALGQSPLGLFSRLFGPEHDLLGRSQGLLTDLIRERPGSLLFWLNRQPHPKARYISVVRDENLSLVGDMVVPTWSQDMNQVYAFAGKVAGVYNRWWPWSAYSGWCFVGQDTALVTDDLSCPY